MAKYEISDTGVIEIEFDSIPSYATRTALKDLKYRWNPEKRVWYASSNPDRVRLAAQLCGGSTTIVEPVSLKHVAIEMNRNCCYCGSVEEFLLTNKANWLSNMKSAFSEEYLMTLGEAQVRAWEDCFDKLHEELPKLTENQRESFTIIFEYALPLESGRRPDVILLSSSQVIILEFKMKSVPLPEDKDQVSAYARDISEYHFESRTREVIPVLVLTRAPRETRLASSDNTLVCSSGSLVDVLKAIIKDPVESCDPEIWMNSKYEPLPTIVEAAKLIMKKEPLPNIRRVNSSGIPQAVDYLSNVANDAEINKEHVLALVTGVPGAGKTFLGLNFVYEVCDSNENANSVYLSGNGPLIKVLQDALHSRVFVQDVHKVVNYYTQGRMKSYSKNIIVFDEGQRAWDRERMKEKRNTNKSEPEVFIEIADKFLEWSLILVLVGEGQEINIGEHSGISQWNDALLKSKKTWRVVCPEKLRELFPGQTVSVKNELDLNTSLRSNLAGDVSKMVNFIISGKMFDAACLVPAITQSHFHMYITRDLEEAKRYCRNLYDGTDKRFGLMASSKANNLTRYIMKPTFQPDVAAWFNRAPYEPNSCCQLKTTISEFDCQGLEVDFPIIGWGEDMVWDGGRWHLYKEDEPIDSENNTYRFNSYRVLLTRGRDGFIIFIPPAKKLDHTFEMFKELGVEEI